MTFHVWKNPEGINEVATRKQIEEARDNRAPRAELSSTHTKVGKTIRALRRQRVLTLLQLSGLTDIDAGSLSRIERGLQGWSAKTLEAIAKALGVDVEKLFEQRAGHPLHEAHLAATVLIPRYRAGTISGEDTGPMVPFPRDLLPKAVRAYALVLLKIEAGFALDFLVDTTSQELQEGKLFAFALADGERIRRVFRRYDGAWRLVVDQPTVETPEEVVPATAIAELRVIGRVVWGGGPL